MKERLLSLLCTTGLALNSLAGGPLELNLKMTDSNSNVTHVGNHAMSAKVATEEIKSKEGYDVHITAVKIYTYDPQKPIRSLAFNIYDKDTSAIVRDEDANGLSGGDSLSLRHDFPSGEKLVLHLRYLDNNDFEVSSEVTQETNELASAYLSTRGLNPAAKYFVNRKISPVVKWGDRLYSDMVFAVENNANPSLPYQDVQKALGSVERLLPKLRTGDKNATDALIDLSDEYMKIIKQNSKGNK